MALNFNPSFSGSIIDFDALRDYNDKKQAQELAMRQAKNASRAKTLEVLGKDIENYIGQQNRIKEGKTFDTEFSKMTPEEQAKFGWISSPEYTEARSVYERTGDPTALNNLRSTWQAQQNADRQFKLQQDQIAANREALAAAKEEESFQNEMNDLDAMGKDYDEANELFNSSIDKLETISDKSLDPYVTAKDLEQVKANIRQLKRMGYTEQADTLQEFVDNKELATATNLAGAKKRAGEKKAKSDAKAKKRQGLLG